MHWILQNNLYKERGVEEMINVLERHDIPYSLHKVVPFIGEIEPDIDFPVETNVVVYGAYSLRHVAKKKGWIPGCFDLSEITYADCVAAWGNNMLNANNTTCCFKDVLSHINNEDFFIRPVVDSKFFAGMIINPKSFKEWWEKVVVLKEDDGSNLRASTQVLISQPKKILKEYRLWIIDGKIATYSLYKLGNKVLYRNEINEDVKFFAESMLSIWQPSRAFVMDIAVMQSDLKIIEINTFNASGLYAADVCKIIIAIEEMKFQEKSNETL